MKLFLIIVMAGTVGGAVGPLPYDMAECQARADEMQGKAARAWEDPATVAKLLESDPSMTRNTVQFRCRNLATRPSLGSPFQP